MYRPSIVTMIALISVLILAACGGSPTLETAPPMPSNTVVPESTLAATPVPSVSEPIVFPEYPCCRGTELEPGHYRTPKWHVIPLEFTVGEGWRAMGERVDNSIWIVQGGLSRADKVVGWIPIPQGMSVDSVWADLRATPGLIVGEETGIVIGGLSGKQFEAKTDPNTEYKFEGAHVELPTMNRIMNLTGAGTFVTETLETSLRFILLPVANRHMLIYMEAPNDEFEAFAAQADEVLHTIQFQDK